MKDYIFVEYNVPVTHTSFEGIFIFWVCLCHKSKNKNSLYCRGCYLPLKSSTRLFDANVFYDKLLTNVYAFQNKYEICICCVFYGRCGEMADFIEGIDELS